MKNFQFYETASACHITPLGHLERPREGYKVIDEPASGTLPTLLPFDQVRGFIWLPIMSTRLLHRQSSFIAEDTRPSRVSL